MSLLAVSPVNPDSLAPLFAPLTSLRGIGPAVAALIARAAGGDRVIDLLFHMPESYLDRTARPTIRAAQPGTVATLAVEVVRHERPATSRQPWRIIVKDDTGIAELVFFRFTRETQTPPGDEAAGFRQAGHVQRPPDDAASGPSGADRAGRTGFRRSSRSGR